MSSVKRLRIAHLSDIHATHASANFARLGRLFLPKAKGEGFGAAITRLFASSWLDRHSLIEPLIRATHFNEPYSLRRFSAIVQSVRAEGADYVVLTGDLANLGAASEMREVMLVLESAGFGSTNLTVVPGNHDRFNLRGIGDFEKAVTSRPYPHLDRPNEHVAVIAMDSTVRDTQLDWRDALVMSSRGIIPIEQIEAADKILAGLEKGVFKILCCHHHVVELPPDGYIDNLGKNIDSRLAGKAENADQLIDVAKGRGVGLVLFGHRHRATHDQFKIRGIPSACSGAVTHPQKDGLMRYRVFDFEGGELIGGQWIEVHEKAAQMTEVLTYLEASPVSESEQGNLVTVKVQTGGMAEGVSKAMEKAREREREALERIRARMNKR